MAWDIVCTMHQKTEIPLSKKNLSYKIITAIMLGMGLLVTLMLAVFSYSFQVLEHELMRENHVEARFPTAHGTVEVTSRPIPGSLRVSPPQKGAGTRKELWGFLQCRPLTIPEPIARPGSIGTL